MDSAMPVVCVAGLGETLQRPCRIVTGALTAITTTRVRLCGRLEVEIGGQRVEQRLPGRQLPLVFALLVLNRERPVSRNELISVLWPAALPADPDEALSALVSKLRRAIGKDRLGGRRELALVLPADVEIDVVHAYAATDRAEAAIAGGDFGSAWEAASTAAEIAGRGFLAGHDALWVEERRGEIAELRLRALEAVARSGVALGGVRLTAAERAARELVVAVPFREAGHRLLMEALAARGEVAEAVAAYEHLRLVLRDELGTTPSGAVRTLHERLLAGKRTAARGSERVPLPALLAPRDQVALVGRELELEHLREAWAGARAGHRGMVLLCGGPGIGKTRLASELAREAHASGTVLYAAGAQDPLVSYQPFVEALRHYARSSPLSADLGPGAAELARLIPELSVPGRGDGERIPEDPGTRRYLMFEAVSALLDTACEETPVLLVLDDLHWADRPTLQLLRHVVRAQHDARLLIVGSYRELDATDDHPLAEFLADLRRDRLLARLALAGLDRSDVASLIASHAGHAVPAGLVETVHAQTDGNPFFVEELVRHLLESGVVAAGEERWTSPLRPEEVGVPEGVREVIMRRVARLSDGCRLVLLEASVLGREFGFELLRAMSDLDEESVMEAIEEGLAAHLVIETQSGADHAFAHALVRETLYETLSTPRRQRLHARAASAVEASVIPDSDEAVGALAVHYRLAGPMADAAKAIEYSLRAGERARELYAWEDAAAHWEGAELLMQRAGADTAARARLLMALGDLSAVVGDLARQIRYLERALALWSELGDHERAAHAYSRLGMARSLIDSIYAEHLDIGQAFRDFDAAREVLDRGPVRKARGHLETGVATAFTYALQIERGIEAARRGMQIAEQVGDQALWAGSAEAYGWHKIVAGELSEGFAAIEQAFAAADRERWPFLAWMACTIRGQMTWGLGDPDSAQIWFERGTCLPYVGKTSFRQENADGIGRCHVSRGELATARRLLSDARPAWITHSLQPLVDLWDGNWDRVDGLAKRVLETSRRTGNRWDEWASHHLAARVLGLRDQPARARDELDRARLIVLDGGARYFELWVLPDLARTLAETGRLTEARTHIERCTSIVAAGEDWRGRRGIAEIAEAVVLSFEGRSDEADSRFASAIATLRQHHLLGDEADALHQWARALDRAGDHDRAAEKLEAASELYQAHGAGQPWLRRVRASARA
jgi:DNA-binding SARP family transcriptional activator/tetratricopeptide (TPR) repeat protein